MIRKRVNGAGREPGSEAPANKHERRPSSADTPKHDFVYFCVATVSFCAVNGMTHHFEHRVMRNRGSNKVVSVGKRRHELVMKSEGTSGVKDARIPTCAN